MGRLTHFAIILALSLSRAEIGFSAKARASLQNKTSKKAPASVSGRITVKGKGKAGIFVGIRTGEFGPQTGPLLKAITNQDGNYRITDLPAGSYQRFHATQPGTRSVSLSHPAFAKYWYLQ